MVKLIKITLFLLVTGLVFQSCSDNSAGLTEKPKTLLFSKDGLVDSAWVTCCCMSSKRFLSDTLYFSGYSQVKVEFDGNTNSDGSQIEILYNTNTSSNNIAFTVHNPESLIGFHSVEFNTPGDTLIIEIRTTIFPPVCGPEELKYTRSRDFKIYGVQ